MLLGRVQNAVFSTIELGVGVILNKYTGKINAKIRGKNVLQFSFFQTSFLLVNYCHPGISQGTYTGYYANYTFLDSLKYRQFLLLFLKDNLYTSHMQVKINLKSNLD